MGETSPRHRFVEHTGEVELKIEAPDLAGVLEEAARAVAELLAEDAAGAPTANEERLTIEARDDESLLAEWLNELLYRGEVKKLVYHDVHVERAATRFAEATLRGRWPASPRTAVKAATWHRLGLREVAGGLEATVVLDV